MPTAIARRSIALVALACLLSLGFQRDTPPLNPSVRSVIAHGARGDGRADDTVAIQAVIDSFATPDATGVVEIPPGVYRITQPLVYSGDYSYGLTIRGGGSAAGPSGTVLLYDGPPGEPVIDLRGCTSTRVERLAIQGGDKARAGIAVRFDADRKAGTSGVYLEQLYIEGTVEAAVSAGFNPDGSRNEEQCDRIILDQCTFQGHGKTQYGFLTGWSNCKNFAVRDCSFAKFAAAAIKFGGSGYMLVDGFVGGGNAVDFEADTGNLEVRAGNSEFSARMLTGSTGANPGSVSITGFSWASNKVPDDQVIISYQGTLDLRGNHFANDRRADSVPKVQLLETAGAMTAVNSAGNFFKHASGSVPVVSWDGGPVRASPVQSFGDFGGAGGQLTRLSGVLDYSDGRRWTPDGLFNGPGSEWTPDGLYPGGGIKWKGSGTLIPGPNESFRYVGWSVDDHGNRRQGFVVKPLKGK